MSITMQHLKMYNLLYIIFLFGLVGTFDSDPISEHICIIKEDTNSSKSSVTCVCSNRENFTYSSVLVYEVSKISIKGCGNVTLAYGSLANLHLEELEFVDLHSLVLKPFSVSRVEKIEVFKIHHISNLIMQQNAFYGLRNVDALILSNVTIDTWSKEAIISISDIRSILIEDSTLGYLENLEISVENVTILRVSNVEFRALEHISFFIMGTEEIWFEDCKFQNTNNGTFIVSHVNCFYFENCTFGNLASYSIKSNDINLFNFSNSAIEVLQADAFADLKVIKEVIFKRNVIRITYDNSLYPIFMHTPDNIGVDNTCCNLFTCSCNIYWLYDVKYPSTVLHNNYCIQKPSLSLSLYEPILDSRGNCKTLEINFLRKWRIKK